MEKNLEQCIRLFLLLRHDERLNFQHHHWYNKNLGDIQFYLLATVFINMGKVDQSALVRAGAIDVIIRVLKSQ